MEVTGTVIKVIRRPTDHGSLYLTVDVQSESGHVSRLKYLHGFSVMPAKGQRVTISGMPLVNYKKVNIGAVQVTVHEVCDA